MPEFEALDVADADIDPPELAPKKSSAEEEVEDSGNDRELTEKEQSDARTFAKALAARLDAVPVPDGLEHWKIIVRAERLPKLKVLQGLIEEYTGEKALVIHHAVERIDSARRHFTRVKQAQDSEASQSVRFWLHETKLLEGVDDPSFVAVAVYDGFANARQLIQQIGRVLRSSDPSRRSAQRAAVFAPPRHMAAIEASWTRYLEFEKYCAENTDRVVISEAALPERVMEAMPDLQYIEGEFRPRYMRDGALTIDDIQLPASAAVFAFAGPEFDTDTVRQEISEAILSNDRFQPMRIDSLPANTIAVAYYGWRTSPWLRQQYFAEWTFGVCVVTKVGSLVFAHDTSGIVFDSSKLAMTRLDQNDLMLAIPKSTDDRKVRIMRMSAASLDMSERAIRAQATRTSSFEDTFTDLLDPGMFPTSAYGRVGLYGRYLGFTQGRVRDGKPNLLALKDYLTWTEELAVDLVEIGSSSNPVFNRYAQLSAPLSKPDAQPLNVLIDLGDSFEDFRGNKDGQPLRELMLDVETPDLCSDVNEDGVFEVQISGSSFPCQITYNSANHRYKVSSDELDQFFHAASPSGRKSAQTFTEMLNRTQSFRVIPKAAGIVYANGKFYRPQGLGRRSDGSFPQLDNVVSVPLLGDLTTEKGEKLYPSPEWRKQSQFGAIKTICEADDVAVLPETYGKLGEELRKFDLVICDDDGQEIGDFLAIDTDRRLVCIIHAKASKEAKHAAVSALQEVGRQALASLAFCSTVAVVPKVSAERWGTDVTANDKVLTGLSRIFRNTKDLTVAQARTTMLDALNNRAWDKEIWVVVARMLNRTTFEARLRDDDRNLTMQTSMYLASLTTSCARANARLKIFCHESKEKDDGDADDAES